MRYFLALLGILGLCAPAGASIVTYTDRAAFEAALANSRSPAHTEIVTDDFTGNTVDPFFTLAGSGYSVTNEQFVGTAETYQWPRLAFLSPVTGFGGDWTVQPASNGNPLNISLVSSGGTSTSTLMSLSNGYSGFFGFIIVGIIEGYLDASTISQVWLTTSPSFTLDNIIVGAIPIPGSLILMLTGLAALSATALVGAKRA
jgi:hypothetical protein